MQSICHQNEPVNLSSDRWKSLLRCLYVNHRRGNTRLYIKNNALLFAIVKRIKTLAQHQHYLGLALINNLGEFKQKCVKATAIYVFLQSRISVTLTV